MTTIEAWMIPALYCGGICHFGILIASAMTPGALDWSGHLKSLPKLLRQMFWVYGAFIVLMIVSFGLITLFNVPLLAEGGTLARWVCGMIAVFWLVRLGVQFFVFDATPFLTKAIYRIGYHGLTVVFTFLVLIYGWIALGLGA
jgi:hypothetical protein